MESGLLGALRLIVGAEHVLTGDGAPEAVVLPGTAAEVSRVLAAANAAGVPVYPRGAGSNPDGAAAPRGGIVLALTRMNRILEIDTANLIAVAEPGVAVGELNRAVAEYGLLYPPDPGTAAAATLGGTVSANAGGLRGLKYGEAKHYIMGLEVVLADGRILNTGGKTVKDVAGYDLTKLVTGAAGTLGVVTRVTVKLVPAPEARQVMLAAFASLDDAGAAMAAMFAAKVIPAALEIMDNATVKAVEAYAPAGLPTDAAAVLLVEVDGIAAAVAQEGAKAAEALTANRATLRVAADAAERDALWAVRRAARPALAGLRPTLLAADATVPRSRVADMVRAVNAIAARHDVAIATFGHAGDGSLYPTVGCDGGDEAELERVGRAMDEVFAAALELGGTLAGGCGDDGLRYTEKRLGPAGLAAMRAVKKALDPNCILNPGKLVGEWSR